MEIEAKDPPEPEDNRVSERTQEYIDVINEARKMIGIWHILVDEEEVSNRARITSLRRISERFKLGKVETQDHGDKGVWFRVL